MHKTPRLYKLIKTIWLLSHGTIMPIAMAYLVLNGHFPSKSIPFVLSFAAVLTFWLIAMSLLTMYRFPLDLKKAGLMVAGLYVQLAIILITAKSILFAFFTGFFSSFVAVTLSMILLLGTGAFRHNTKWWHILIPLIGIGVGGFVTYEFSIPIIETINALPFWAKILATTTIAANIYETIKELKRYTAFSKDPIVSKEYNDEWYKWGTPTVLVFILSSVAAFIVAGILQ